MIFKDEMWIQICCLDDDGNIHFSKEILELTKDICCLRKFVSQLISHWDKTLSSLLDNFDDDNFGTNTIEENLDIRDDICDLWEYKDLALPGLDSCWYRDIARAKLVSIKIPVRLIKEYVNAAVKFYN